MLKKKNINILVRKEISIAELLKDLVQKNKFQPVIRQVSGGPVIKLAILLTLVLFNSCAKLKKILIVDNAEIKLKKEVLKKIEEKKIPDYILIENASVKIEGEETNRARLNFFLEKDKQIFISVKFIGFEMARFQLTQDSIKFINRLKREYYFGNLKNDRSELTELLDLNFTQNLISRGFIMEGANDFDNFFNNSEIRGDSLLYRDNLGTSHNICCMYNLESMQLFRLFYIDYVKQLEANVYLQRKSKDLKKITGYYMDGNNRTNFELDIGNIKKESYSKTNFNIGRNYRELKSLL